MNGAAHFCYALARRIFGQLINSRGNNVTDSCVLNRIVCPRVVPTNNISVKGIQCIHKSGLPKKEERKVHNVKGKVTAGPRVGREAEKSNVCCLFLHKKGKIDECWEAYANVLVHGLQPANIIVLQHKQRVFSLGFKKTEL